MRLRTLLSAAFAAAFALSSEAALSSAHQRWAGGPVQFLMTADEAAKWKTIGSDREAADFIRHFWLRRDPTPGTPRNEYREQFDARVEYANKSFAAGERIGGAMSDRGRALILFGVPQGTSSSGGSGARFDHSVEARRDTNSWIEWEYAGPNANAIFGAPSATVRFVDHYGSGEFRFDRRAEADIAAAQQRAIQRSLAASSAATAAAPPAAATPQQRVGPPVTQTAGALATPTAGASATPTAGASAPQTADAVTAQPDAPAEPQFTATTPAAIEEARREKLVPSFVSFGEYVTPAGVTFIPVSLYVGGSAGILPSRSLTFFGLVQDESGKTVATFDEPATLVATKDDFYVDRSLDALPAGRYRGTFGLSEDGKPVTLTTVEMQLAGPVEKGASGVSQLLLSNNVYALSVAQRATDPYAFGGLKVIPKGDRTFRASDDLWYFLELRNPGLVEPSPDYVPIVGVPVAQPRVQVKIDVEGTDAQGNKRRLGAPLREVEALQLKGVPGHYGIGNSFPLATLKPGDYTFTLKVIDTVKKASYTVSEKFRIAE